MEIFQKAIHPAPRQASRLKPQCPVKLGADMQNPAFGLPIPGCMARTRQGQSAPATVVKAQAAKPRAKHGLQKPHHNNHQQNNQKD